MFFLNLLPLAQANSKISLPSSASSFLSDPNSLISSALANSMVMAIGLGMDHRAYEPATPLGTGLGFDIGIEVTLAKPPSNLASSLSSTLSTLSGSSSSSSSLSMLSELALPSVKAQIHKGISDWVDIGVSALPSIASIPYIGGSSFYGGDIKVCIFRPEEGPTVSVRASFDMNLLKISPVQISTTTISPQIIISKKMEFADPYIGTSVQYTYGSVQLSYTPPALPAPFPTIGPIVLTQSGNGFAGNLFGGVSLRVPGIGFRITLEGAYNTASVVYVGTKISFNF